jgi:hypothetical protein
MFMKLSFIPDGYEFDGVIPANDFHDEVKIRYRPMLPEDVSAIVDKQQGKSAVEKTRIEIEECADRIKSWSITGPDGDAIPVNSANMKRIPIVLSNSIRELVQGYRASPMESERKN